jgi:hypothetical protein
MPAALAAREVRHTVFSRFSLPSQAAAENIHPCGGAMIKWANKMQFSRWRIQLSRDCFCCMLVGMITKYSVILFQFNNTYFPIIHFSGINFSLGILNLNAVIKL